MRPQMRHPRARTIGSGPNLVNREQSLVNREQAQSNRAHPGPHGGPLPQRAKLGGAGIAVTGDFPADLFGHPGRDEGRDVAAQPRDLLDQP